jgi:hypothetical protein
MEYGQISVLTDGSFAKFRYWLVLREIHLVKVSLGISDDFNFLSIRPPARRGKSSHLLSFCGNGSALGGGRSIMKQRFFESSSIK